MQFGHKWNPVYQRFCGNMEEQRGFVKALQQLPDFQEYLKVRTPTITHCPPITVLYVVLMVSYVVNAAGVSRPSHSPAQ